MSLPLLFTFYGFDGELIGIDHRLGSVVNFDQYSNLNAIHRKFFESFYHPMLWIDNKKNIYYASPNHIKDYMFDVRTGELLPNKFIK